MVHKRTKQVKRTKKVKQKIRTKQKKQRKQTYNKEGFGTTLRKGRRKKKTHKRKYHGGRRTYKEIAREVKGKVSGDFAREVKGKVSGDFVDKVAAVEAKLGKINENIKETLREKGLTIDKIQEMLPKFPNLSEMKLPDLKAFATKLQEDMNKQKTNLISAIDRTIKRKEWWKWLQSKIIETLKQSGKIVGTNLAKATGELGKTTLKATEAVSEGMVDVSKAAKKFVGKFSGEKKLLERLEFYLEQMSQTKGKIYKESLGDFVKKITSKIEGGNSNLKEEVKELLGKYPDLKRAMKELVDIYSPATEAADKGAGVSAPTTTTGPADTETEADPDSEPTQVIEGESMVEQAPHPPGNNVSRSDETTAHLIGVANEASVAEFIEGNLGGLPGPSEPSPHSETRRRNAQIT